MQIEVCKYHLSGILEGLSSYETMNFVDWDTACEWASGVTMNSDVPYVVLTLTDQKSGKIQKF